MTQEEPKCTCKEHDPYCCQVHGTCPTCVIQEDPLSYTEAAKKEERMFNAGMGKQEKLEEAAEWLNKKFDGKGVEIKIIDWGKNERYNYPPSKLLEEYAKWQAERIPSIIEEYLETAFISKEQGFMNPQKWFEQYKK
jgi:hypothetical protein